MTYKETLFFVGKCLTINHEEHNKILIENELKTNTVDWDNVVKVSTAHYVFPALYCNLKKANFLNYLPDDLVEYMQHITDLNRERNEQIIIQAKEINNLLINNNITPIFLKGTGNLLEGLYDDIAERMVGDIDFLVAEEDLYKSANLLENNNYEKVIKQLYSPIFQKHYPRLFNENKIAAVEVHLKIIRGSASSFFDYNTIYDYIFSKNNYNFLGYTDQLTLTTLAIQHNDYGYNYKNVSLRNSYDVYLLSLKEDNLKSLEKNSTFFKKLNSYFYVSSIFLNSKKIKYKETTDLNSYFKTTLLKINKPNFNKYHTSIWKFILLIYRNFLGLIKFITKKEFRLYYIKRLFS